MPMKGGANRIHCLTSYPGWSGKLKLDTEGVHTMCELMKKFGERKLEEGRLEGRVESARQTAMALIALGKLIFSQIAEATQLSQEEVERLAGSTGA